jgi:hypothetical protein
MIPRRLFVHPADRPHKCWPVRDRGHGQTKLHARGPYLRLALRGRLLEEVAFRGCGAPSRRANRCRPTDSRIHAASAGTSSWSVATSVIFRRGCQMRFRRALRHCPSTAACLSSSSQVTDTTGTALGGTGRRSVRARASRNDRMSPSCLTPLPQTAYCYSRTTKSPNFGGGPARYVCTRSLRDATARAPAPGGPTALNKWRVS